MFNERPLASSIRNTIPYKSIFVGALAAACVFSTGLATAADTPSNEDLYQMILELQADQERLQHEADLAKAETAKAKHELELTRRVLDATQEKLKVTEQEILQTQEVVAATQEGLAETQAEMGTGPSSSVVKIPDKAGGWTAMAEVMFMRPSTGELDFAIEDPQDGSKVTTGRVLSVDTDYEPGFQIGVGYDFAGTGVDAKLAWSRLRTSNDESATAPAGSTLIATLSSKGTGEGSSDADSARANVDFDYDVVDFEVGQTFQAGSSVDIRLFGGVRYANMDHDMEVFYQGGTFDAQGPDDGALVTSKVDFSGIGPRIGVGGSWDLGSDFSLFGHTAVSLLVSDFDASHVETSDSQNNPFRVNVTQDFDTRVVPVVEISLGAGWVNRLSWGLLTLRGGYEVQNWFNVVDPLDFSKASSLGASNPGRGNTTDMGLDGFFFRGNVEF